MLTLYTHIIYIYDYVPCTVYSQEFSQGPLVITHYAISRYRPGIRRFINYRFHLMNMGWLEEGLDGRDLAYSMNGKYKNCVHCGWKITNTSITVRCKQNYLCTRGSEELHNLHYLTGIEEEATTGWVGSTNGYTQHTNVTFWSEDLKRRCHLNASLNMGHNITICAGKWVALKSVLVT
jgi:hypothetical protein